MGEETRRVTSVTERSIARPSPLESVNQDHKHNPFTTQERQQKDHQPPNFTRLQLGMRDTETESNRCWKVATA